MRLASSVPVWGHGRTTLDEIRGPVSGEQVTRTEHRSVEGGKRIDWSRAHVVGPRGARVGRHYDLRTLRDALGRTQSDIADAADMGQGDVSKLGGRVEVAVVIGGRRYLLDLRNDAGGETTAEAPPARPQGARRTTGVKRRSTAHP